MQTQNEFDKLVHSTSIPLEVPMGMSRSTLREKLIARGYKSNHKALPKSLDAQGEGELRNSQTENLDL